MSKTGYPEPSRSLLRKSHCPPEGLGRLCRRPGDVLGRELSLTLRTSRFQTLPGSLWGALGSISESLQLPKMMNFERLVCSFPRALFAARFDCLRYLFSSRLLCFLAARAQGPNAKIDTPSMRKPVFSRYAPAPGAPQGRQQTTKNGSKSRRN